MDDSPFHIVQRNDGQFELVRLAPVKKKVNSKLGQTVNVDSNNENENNLHTKDNCTCISCCHPALKQYLIPKRFTTRQINETTIEASGIYAPKTYSRVRKTDSSGNIIKNEPILIHKNKTETAATTTATVAIKAEPELDILDDREEGQAKIENLNVEERLTSSENHVGNQSIKIVQKVSSAPVTDYDVDPDKIRYVNKPLLLKLAKRNVKCNICGMIFSKGDNQVKLLRNHFLQHKTSVLRGARINNDVHCQPNEFDERLKSANSVKLPKKPILLNNMLRCMNSEVLKNVTVKTVKKCVPKNRGHNSGNSQSQLEPDRNHKNFVISANLSTSLSQRKLLNIKPISRDFLEQLRSNNSDSDNGLSHFILGNTFIRPVKPANSIEPSTDVLKNVDEELLTTNGHLEVPEAKPSDEAGVSDADDDDVEIVEQEPEVIVIDDNDEEGEPDEPQ